MKILFGALHCASFRNFESVIGGLADRGHRVHLWVDEPESLGGQELVETIVRRYPTVSWSWSPSPERESWFNLARKLRHGLDYLRFLEPGYAPFPKLRDRAVERVPQVLLWLLRLPFVSTSAGRRTLSRVFGALDAAMPRHGDVDQYLRTERPDLVLLASVTNPRAPQLDHLRSARALGIPTGVCVYSWDHLSSKTLIRVLPDRVFVWNDTQKREAIDLHAVPAERIVVTGAQCYDQWFDRPPTRTREAFCRDAGLPSDRPFLLYVCSALTPDPGEARFVAQWIERIRASGDSALRGAGILIRPHPERRGEWAGVDLSRFEHIVVAGSNPVNDTAKADYHDALVHSAAVVGLVTSAFLEAAIAGRPVHTLLLPEFRTHQEGMLHFRYLLEVEDGLLQVAHDFDQHITLLTASLNGKDDEGRRRRFLTSFVRPAGLDTPATPIFVNEVERLGALTPEPARDMAWQRRLRPLVRRLAHFAEHGAGRRLFLEPRLVQEQQERDARVRQSRRDTRNKWRRHRQQKLVNRVQWKMKRLRELVATGTLSRPDR